MPGASVRFIILRMVFLQDLQGEVTQVPRLQAIPARGSIVMLHDQDDNSPLRKLFFSDEDLVNSR